MDCTKMLNGDDKKKFHKLVNSLSIKDNPQIFNIVKSAFDNDDTNLLLSRLNDHCQFAYKKTAIHYAAYKKSETLIKLLILLGADINCRNALGETPLFVAISPLNKRVKYYPNNYNIRHNTVRQQRIHNLNNWSEHGSILKLLLAHKANPNIPNNLGITPLQNALLLGSGKIVKILLPKIFANIVFSENLDIVKFLLDKEEVIIPRSNFNTLLYFTAITNDEDALKLVLEKSSSLNVNAVGPYRETLLKIVVLWGNQKIINSLVDYGIDLNFNDLPFSPLVHALIFNKDMVETLLKKGASTEDDRLPPITVAIIFQSPESVKLLAKYGADIEGSNIIFPTPLHTACVSKSGHGRVSLEIIEILLDMNANINALDKGKLTPLERCANRGEDDVNLLVVQTLVAKIAKMRVCHEYVSEQNIRCVENHHFVKDIYTRCEDEIKLMKKKKLYGLLGRNLEKMTNAARNQNVEIFDNEYMNEFPIHGSKLKKCFDRAKSRMGIIDRSRVIFNKVIEYSLPNMIFEGICGYLSDEDLGNFMKANARNGKEIVKNFLKDDIVPCPAMWFLKNLRAARRKLINI